MSNELERLRRDVQDEIKRFEAEFRDIYGPTSGTLSEQFVKRLRAILKPAPEVVEAGGVLFVKTGEHRHMEMGDTGIDDDGLLITWTKAHTSYAKYQIFRPLLDMRECVGAMIQAGHALRVGTPGEEEAAAQRIDAILANVPELPEVS